MPEPSGEPVTYYVSTGPSSYRPTSHAQGAWAPDQQHMGPISGLLVQVLEGCSPRPELTLSRIAFDILGVTYLDEVTVQAEVVRPGRTIELLEATLVQHDRVVVRAHAWRLLTSDTTQLAGVTAAPMPGPDQATVWDGSQTWSGGFIASLEMRVLPGRRLGRGQVWIRPRVPVLESTRPGELAYFLGMVDTMNGVAIRVPPETAAFPNTDLTVHLFRRPTGEWLGLDVEVAFGPVGVGMTSSALHDETGLFGRALQILTIRQGH
jgi:hypothetical protein